MATAQERTWRSRGRKLTAEQVAEARALPWERGSLTRLAKEFGISKSVIWRIRQGYAYKRADPQRTYVARVTDNRERISLGTFLTAEAAQAAIDEYGRSNKWPRGSIERAKGRYRVRLSLGTYETRHAAERSCAAALEKLGS